MIQSKHIRYLTVCLISIVTACVEPLDEQAIIDRRIASKISEYQARRLKECQEKATEAAEAHVDSLIANWVGSEVIDTLAFPNRPTRPKRPKDIIGTVDKWK